MHNTHEDATQDLLDQRIAELVDVVRATQQRIAALEKRNQEARAELANLLAQRGANWSDDEGYARLVSAGVRQYYDSRALDRLIIEDPLRYGWLQDYRTEATVRGGVQVK
jgi:hypothetical protein